MQNHTGRRSRSIKYPGLYFFDTESRRCYKVAFSSHGKNIQEYFHFGKRRTKSQAKQLAIARLAQLRTLYPFQDKLCLLHAQTRDTTSPVTGVTQITNTSKGYSYTSWRTSWVDRNGKRRQKVFSINKYGDEQAKALAIEARQIALENR